LCVLVGECFRGYRPPEVLGSFLGVRVPPLAPQLRGLKDLRQLLLSTRVIAKVDQRSHQPQCGAKNVRLIVGLGGQSSGSFVLSHEADDHAAAGAILDKFLADSEGLALMMESGTEGGPTASWQTSTWVEIPL